MTHPTAAARPREVMALAVSEEGASFGRRIIERRELGPRDVSVAVAYCGVCASDVNAVRNEWGSSRYPQVPGHEITGVVEAVGAQVEDLTPGDRVAVGALVDSCRTCENCTAGEEQYCLNGRVGTYNSIDKQGNPTFGGLSEALVVDRDFVLALPDGLDMAAAAPLLCAGITVYSPLRHLAVGPGTRVAVVGLGGLGHMAVKIAAAMGAEVTVLSRGVSKRDDALGFGATRYVPSDDDDEVKAMASTQDVVLSTISVPSVDRYLALLRRGGTLVSAGLSSANLSASPTLLMRNRRSILGSNVGGIAETAEMLAFCADEGISAEVEVVGIDYIDEAFSRLAGGGGDIRYRLVVDMGSIREDATTSA